MLKQFRKKGVAKKILWVVAAIIIPSFAIFGTIGVMNNTKSQPSAGKIFGKKIKIEDYDKSYREVQMQAMLRFGEKFGEISQFLNLEGETWDRIILLYEANKRNIKVTDEEVVENIAQYPIFQRNGKFDQLLYNDIIRYVMKTKPRQFEENARESIKLAKLYKDITADVTVSDEDVKEAFKNQNEKVQVSYALVSAEKLAKDIPVEESEIQNYYNENSHSFLTPPSVNAEIIKLDFKKDGEELDKNSVRARADVIYEDIKKNPNLNEIATKHNVPLTETGFFSLEQPNLSFGWTYEKINEIFNLAVGGTLPPIETEQGVYLVKMKEKKEAFVPSLEEVKDKVKAALTGKKSMDMAKAKAQEYLTTIKEQYENSKTKDFAEIVKKLGLEIVQTPVFNRGQYLPQIGLSGDFQDTAFALTTEKPISDVVEAGRGYAILHLDSYTPVDEAEFAKQKETFTKNVLEEKQNSRFNEFLTDLRLKANLEDNMSKLKSKAQ